MTLADEAEPPLVTNTGKTKFLYLVYSFKKKTAQIPNLKKFSPIQHGRVSRPRCGLSVPREGLFAFLDTGLWLLLAIRANCSLHVGSNPPSTLEEPPPWVPLQSKSFWVQPIARADQGRSRK